MKVKIAKWLHRRFKHTMEPEVKFIPKVPSEEVKKEYWVVLPDGKKANAYDINIGNQWLFAIDCYSQREKIFDIQLNTWTSPMFELFNLWRRDSHNFKDANLKTSDLIRK